MARDEDHIQSKLDKFLERKWIDVKGKDPAQDAALLEQNRLNGNQADKLFENLIKRISGGMPLSKQNDNLIELSN